MKWFIEKTHVGYYDSPYPDAQPAHEPPYPVPCPYCGKEVNDENVRTLSIMMPAKKGTDIEISCFYRVHRACDTAATEPEKGELDEVVFKMMGVLE